MLAALWRYEGVKGAVPNGGYVFNRYIQIIEASLDAGDYQPVEILYALLTAYCNDATLVTSQRSLFWKKVFAYVPLATQLRNKIKIEPQSLTQNTDSANLALAESVLLILNGYYDYSQPEDDFIKLLDAFFTFYPNYYLLIENPTLKALVHKQDFNELLLAVIDEYVSQLISTKPSIILAVDFAVARLVNKLPQLLAALIDVIKKRHHLYGFRSLQRAISFLQAEQVSEVMQLCFSEISLQTNSYILDDIIELLALTVERKKSLQPPAELIRCVFSLCQADSIQPFAVKLALAYLSNFPVLISDENRESLIRCIESHVAYHCFFPTLIQALPASAQRSALLSTLEHEIVNRRSSRVYEIYQQIRQQLQETTLMLPIELTNIAKLIAEQITTAVVFAKSKSRRERTNALIDFSRLIPLADPLTLKNKIIPAVLREVLAYNQDMVSLAYNALGKLADLPEAQLPATDKRSIAEKLYAEIKVTFLQSTTAFTVLRQYLNYLQPATIQNEIIPAVLACPEFDLKCYSPSKINTYLISFVIHAIPLLSTNYNEHYLWPKFKSALNLSFTPSSSKALSLLHTLLDYTSPIFKRTALLPWLQKFVQSNANDTKDLLIFSSHANAFICKIIPVLSYAERIFWARKFLVAYKEMGADNCAYLLSKIYSENKTELQHVSTDKASPTLVKLS